MVNQIKKVSVIIPTLGREEALLNTVTDLIDLEYPGLEIIVIDQTEKSSLRVLDFIHQHQKIINYIRTNHKSSPKARNLGVKNAIGEILLFVDDDVAIRENNFINYHLENYKDTRVGMVGGRVVYDFKEEPPNKKNAGKLKFLGLKEVTNFNSDLRQEIDFVYGCNFSCRKSVYRAVGGYNDIYIGNAHMEETDLSQQVKKAGYKIVFDPKAVLRHVRTETGGNRVNDIYEFRYWLVHNETVFYLKNYPKALFPLFFVTKFLWAISSGIKRMDMKMFRKMYGAMIDGKRYYKKINT